MKSKLLLIFFFSVIFCSQPFLRKLDEEVTEESCKAQKKKYQAAVSATCKKGNIVFDVENEDDCKAGTWDGSKEGCSVDGIDKQNCNGKPSFESGTPATEEKCKLSNNEEISLKGEDCDTTIELVWIAGLCGTEPKTQESDCTVDGTSWTAGICIDSSGSCSGDDLKQIGKVCINTSKSSSDCNTDPLSWSTGVCSNPKITDSSKCTGKLTHEDAKAEVSAKCVFQGKTLSGITTQKECEVDVEWTNGSCSNEQVKNKEDCEKAGTYTAGTPAKCVDADSDADSDDDSDDDSDSSSKSSSNFLKAINFVLIAVCLLL